MAVRWKGDAETGDLSQWASHVEFVPDRLRVVNAASPGGIAPFQGNWCYRFEVRNGEDTPGDNSTNQRAELGQANPGNGPRFVAGQEDWITDAIYFPNAFPKANWQAILQFKNDGANPPPGGMSCNNDVISFDMGGSAKGLAGNGGILWTTPLVRNVWHTFMWHILWSETTTGYVELWHNGVKVLNKTQTANLFPGIKNHARIGFYRAAAIAGTGVLYHDAYGVFTTQAEAEAQLAGVTGGGGVTPPPVATTRTLDVLSETFDTTGPQFLTRAGVVSISGSRLQLGLDATTARSFARTAEDLVPAGKGVIVGPITWPTWISGSGEVQTYVTFDMGTGSRFVLRRRTTYAGSATPTADQVESRLVVAETDATPVLTNWSAVPGSTQYFKLGFLADRSAAYQVSADGLSFTPVATRATPAAVDLSSAGFVEVGVVRASGAVAVTTAAIDNIAGTNTPAAGSAAGKSDNALHFDGTHVRVFPLAPGTAQALLVISKAANASKTMVPTGLSKAGSPLLDNANRADGPIGSNYVGANGTLPVIAGNAFSTGASVTNARAIWNTSVGGPDNGPVFTYAGNGSGVKHTAPAAKLFNFMIGLVRITGSTTTATGYAPSAAFNIDGTLSFYFAKIINGSLQAALAGSPGGSIAFGVGDQFAPRAVGSTLQWWRKPVGGAWTLVGSLTDTTYTTGNFIGFGGAAVGTVPLALDNLYGGTYATTTEPPPPDRSGRAMRITTARQPQFWDGTLSTPNGFGAGTLPSTPAWSMELVARDTTSGQVATRVWDPATGAFQENGSAGSLGAGSSISDTNARFVIGDREPGAATDMSFVGDIALVAAFSADPGATAFEGTVQAGGVVSIAALKATSTITRLYDMTQLAAPTDQIQDSVGTAHEVTAERVGTGTIATDTGNVPVAAGGAVVNPPTPAASVPDPVGFAVTNAIIDPAAPTTGKLHLHIDAPVADASIGFTPHATPISFWWSADDGVSWTQQGSWQSATDLDVTGLPLDPGDGSTARLWSARYRSNAATPLLSDFAPPEQVLVAAADVVDPVPPAEVIAVQNNGGTMNVYWSPSNGDYYDVKYAEAVDEDPTHTVFPVQPFYEGAGTTVSTGPYVGKLTTPDPITGLDDLKVYDVSVDTRRGTA